MDVAKLPHHLAVHMRDGMQLVEGQQCLLVLADVHIYKAKVVNGLQAVGAHPDGLKVNLFGTLKLIIHKHAISFVHKGAGIVSVCLHSDVRVLLSIRVVGFEEVEEGKIRRCTSHQRRLFALELFQQCDCLVKLLPPQEKRSLGNLKLRGDAGEAMLVQRIDDPIIASNRRLVHDRCNEVGGVHDEAGSLALPTLDVLAKCVVSLRELPGRVFRLGPSRGLQKVHLLLIKVFEADLFYVQQLQEATLHLVLVTKRIVAKHQIEASLEVEVLSTMHQEVLIRVDRIGKLVHLEKSMADVSHYFETNRLHIVWYLVEGHSIHLDCTSPLLLLEINVTHIYTESSTERILLVLHNLRVDCQCLVVVVVSLMLDGKVQAHSISEVNIQLIQKILRLTKPAELTLLLAGLLAFLQGLS
mmetsp:Transcript_990/g.1776  ORF Transcript_990/g.1776 Transcript_990/m.1776 type:complete len:413 (-) Transcript_990:505-1743(-)